MTNPHSRDTPEDREAYEEQAEKDRDRHVRTVNADVMAERLWKIRVDNLLDALVTYDFRVNKPRAWMAAMEFQRMALNIMNDQP